MRGAVNDPSVVDEFASILSNYKPADGVEEKCNFAREFESNGEGCSEERNPKRVRVSDENLTVKSSDPGKINNKGKQIVIEIDPMEEVEVIDLESDEEGNLVVNKGKIGRNDESFTVKRCSALIEIDDDDGEGEVRENGKRDVADNGKSNGGGEIHENGERGVGDSGKLNAAASVGGSVEGRLKLPVDGGGEEVRKNGEQDVNDAASVGESVEGRLKLPVDGGGEEVRKNGEQDVNVAASVGESVEGRRKLPLSMRGGNMNFGLAEPVVQNSRSFMSLMEKLSTVFEKSVTAEDKNADFFETAKKRGVTFPRPRWWRTEGTEGFDI